MGHLEWFEGDDNTQVLVQRKLKSLTICKIHNKELTEGTFLNLKISTTHFYEITFKMTICYLGLLRNLERIHLQVSQLQ